MKKPILLLALLGAIFGCGQGNTKKTNPESNTEVTTYYLIRHAEKDRSDPANKDPNLTEAGRVRAKNWAQYFDSIPLDQIYSTGYHRTQQTIAYTATNQNLPSQEYDPDQLYTEDFQILTQGQKVLIVGHSNTTPMFVNAILGEEKYPWMDDSDNASLYIVTVEDGKTSVVIEVVN
ncbi:MAG: phosphoglycerate mutase family protein [Bacteroidetes bacterium]|nr:phosphoglycerate mutase family protein [Bacteroidota bacterium]